MGRPLNKRHFGAANLPGKQVTGTAWIPGESSAEEVIVIQQKTTQKYEVVSVNDENIRGFVTTANTDTPLEGEFSIPIDPNDGTGNSTGVEYVRQINSGQVKTFDGNTYAWDQLLSADFSGPIASVFSLFTSMTIGFTDSVGQDAYGYDSAFSLGSAAPTLLGETLPNGGITSYVSFNALDDGPIPGYFNLVLAYDKSDPGDPELERMTFREDARININGVEYAFPYDASVNPTLFAENAIYYLDVPPSSTDGGTLYLYVESPNPVYYAMYSQLLSLFGQTVPVYIDFGQPSSAP